MMVATGAVVPAPAVSFRSQAKRTPMASQRRRACPPRAAAGDSAVCPVVPASHAEPTPTGRPNVALRPVSELAVSSSKALEAFKASGASSRACAAARPPCCCLPPRLRRAAAAVRRGIAFVSPDTAHPV